MSNPSSTSNSEHEQHLALLGKPRRLGTLLGLVLFLILNGLVGRHYFYEQRTQGKPDGPRNNWPLWQTANRDSADDIKVLCFGNSIQQHFLDFASFEKTLQTLTTHTLHVYDLGSEGAYLYQYAALYTQLKMDRRTIVLLPIYCQNFISIWNPFGTDWGALMIHPAVLRLIPRGFVQSMLHSSEFCSALLKHAVPLYRLKDCVQSDLQSYDPKKIAAPALRGIFQDWIARVSSRPGSINNHEGVENDKEPAWMTEIFENLLSDMERRKIPHFVYFVPTIHDMGWRFDAVLKAPREILRRHGTPMADLTDLMPDNEFFDIIHPKNSKQLMALLTGWQNRKPIDLIRVRASAFNITLAGTQLVVDPNLTPHDAQVDQQLACYLPSLGMKSHYQVLAVSLNLAPLPRLEPGQPLAAGHWTTLQGKLILLIQPRVAPPKPDDLRIQIRETGIPPFLRLLKEADL